MLPELDGSYQRSKVITLGMHLARFQAQQDTGEARLLIVM